MPQPYDYFGAMGGAANIGGINQNIQNTLLGQQNIQQNDNILAQQQRAEQARQALAVATDPNAAPELRNQAMGHLQQTDPAQAQALRQQMQQRQALGAYFQNPTAKGTMELITNFPALKDEISKGWDVYQGAAKDAKLAATADAYGYLNAGDPVGAVNIVRSHMDADKAAGLDINGYQDLIDAIQANPTAGKAIAGLMLAAGAGPEKFAEAHGKIGENARADQLQPEVLRQKAAEATTAEVGAQFAPQVAQSGLDTAAAQRQRMADQSVTDLMNARTAQGTLSLNRDRLDFDVQAHIDDIEQKVGKLTPGSEKIVNDSSAEAAAKQQVAEQEKGLAARIRQSGLSAGPRASAAEAYKSIWGTQDAYTQIRNEYNRLRNSAAMANKSQMPGSMSNADRDFLLQGMPPPNANPEHIAKFLDIMAKAHEGMAKQEDAKAIWAATNGNLGPATRPFVIDGYRIPKGMTLAQHQSALAKINGPGLPADAEAVAARARGQ